MVFSLFVRWVLATPSWRNLTSLMNVVCDYCSIRLRLFIEHGGIGAPTLASETEGRRLLAAMLGDLCTADL